jgi:hypothetical protein
LKEIIWLTIIEQLNNWQKYYLKKLRANKDNNEYFFGFQVDVKREHDSTTTGEFMFVPRYPTYSYQQYP